MSEFALPVPGGGDAYVLKNVIHARPGARVRDDPEQCRVIPNTPGTTLLLVELVIP